MIFEKVIFEFNELKHQYHLNGVPLTSVSKLIEHFVPEFDEEYWSLYTAIRNKLNMEKKVFSKYLIQNFKFNFKGERESNFKFLQKFANSLGGVNVPKVEKEWELENKKSLVKGTKFHNSQEEKVIKEGVKNYNNVNFQYASFPDLYNLAKDVPVIYPELRMYNEEYGIAGTSDEIYMFPNKTFYVDDFKSNKEIKMENKWGKMKPPLSHLEDCNYIHYKLQMSTYAWMLERFGYTCLGTNFTHHILNEEGISIETTPYVFSPMFKEVKLMLNHFK